jgi:hypothetical protein
MALSRAQREIRVLQYKGGACALAHTRRLPIPADARQSPLLPALPSRELRVTADRAAA